MWYNTGLKSTSKKDLESKCDNDNNNVLKELQTIIKPLPKKDEEEILNNKIENSDFSILKR